MAVPDSASNPSHAAGDLGDEQMDTYWPDPFCFSFARWKVIAVAVVFIVIFASCLSQGVWIAKLYSTIKDNDISHEQALKDRGDKQAREVEEHEQAMKDLKEERAEKLAMAMKDWEHKYELLVHKNLELTKAQFPTEHPLKTWEKPTSQTAEESVSDSH